MSLGLADGCHINYRRLVTFSRVYFLTRGGEVQALIQMCEGQLRPVSLPRAMADALMWQCGVGKL